MAIIVSMPDIVADFVYWRMDEALGSAWDMDDAEWEKMNKWKEETFRPKMVEVWDRLEKLQKEE